MILSAYPARTKPTLVRTFSVESTASPAVAWRLIARPGEWPSWAPHVRDAWGLGSPEVPLGAAGAARLFGALPVPVRIVAKRPGRSWTWRIGLVEMVHRVGPHPVPPTGRATAPLGGGCEVAVDLIAPAPLERAVASVYGPVIALTLRRLARRAEGA